MNFKKLIALVLAAVMMMTVMSAFAAPDGDPVNTPKGSITISGLQNGDAVTLYKVIGWYTKTTDKNTTNNWQVETPFEGVFTTIDDAKEVTTSEAVALANKVTASTPVAATGTASGTSCTIGDLPVGMYLAIVQTSSEVVVYNPMILSVNFNQDNPSEAVNGTLPATSDLMDATSAYAKKQTVTLEKENNTTSDDFTAYTNTGKAAANVAEGVGVGSVLPYTVTVTVPSYTKSYEKPKFTVTDTLSKGLELDTSSLTVKVGGTALTENDDYKITKSGKSGYTIDFTSEYLWSARGTTQAVIEYKATVTTNAVNNVNRENNTVELEFSNNPSDETSYDKSSDETNHYTFSLDALIKGNISGRSVTSELIKTGHDGDGNPLFSWNTSEGEIWTSETKLEGAKFLISGTLNGKNWSSEITSGPNGELVIKGLDEGTYTLKETKAPKGYIADTNTHTIVITAEYKDETNGSGKTYKVLKNYTVTVDGNETTYVVTNVGSDDIVTSDIVTNTTTAIVNTKGLELPSTGGIGTTLFYAIGGLMVLAAGIVLVTRRKAEEE